MSTEIDDLRSAAQFKDTTFSGFKKTEVRKQMLENMIKGRIEHACYWCAELICAGQFLDAWENIFHFLGKHVHLGNPKMAIYVEMRYAVFRNIMGQGLYTSEIQVRNKPEIRRLFAEVICNLTLSPRKPSFEPVKIKRAEEFDMTQMRERLKATSTEFGSPLFLEKDPQELFVAINEFAYSLSIKNMSMCCYWIEWMIEFEMACKSRKQPTRCVSRDYPVENRFRQDPIWLVWDAIFKACPSTESFTRKVMQSILSIFCSKYTTATSKKRRYLLYMAVEMLTEPVQTSTEIVANKEMLSSVVSQIDHVYKQVKKNEQGTKTDYLFGKTEQEANFQRTVQKLNMMDSMERV